MMISKALTDVFGVVVRVPLFVLSFWYAKTHVRTRTVISGEETEKPAAKEAESFNTEALEILDTESN